MGIIRSYFTFIVGTAVGVYIAQNYDVPNIQKLVNTYLDKAKTAEQNYRKRNKRGSDGDDGAA